MILQVNTENISVLQKKCIQGKIKEDKAMKLYEVVAKCGHVGRKNYVLKSFPVKAENGREAAKITRYFPRVKHHHKDAIREVIEIDEIRFCELLNNNNEDPYFHCNCVQDQRAYTEINIYKEKVLVDDEEPESTKMFIGKTLVRKPKKYIRNYYYEEGWAY